MDAKDSTAKAVRETLGGGTRYYGNLTDSLFSGLDMIASALSKKEEGERQAPRSIAASFALLADSLDSIATQLEFKSTVDVTPVAEAVTDGCNSLKAGLCIEINQGFTTLSDSIRYLADAVRTNPKV